jgi:hypothetical protein
LSALNVGVWHWAIVLSGICALLQVGGASHVLGGLFPLLKSRVVSCNTYTSLNLHVTTGLYADQAFCQLSYCLGLKPSDASKLLAGVAADATASGGAAAAEQARARLSHIVISNHLSNKIAAR